MRRSLHAIAPCTPTLRAPHAPSCTLVCTIHALHVPSRALAQVASTKPSTPRFGFGTSNRDHQEKVYISADHEKASAGKDAPGPGAYSISAMTGNKQAVSNIPTAAAFGFGSAKRFDKMTRGGGTPGPGSYVV